MARTQPLAAHGTRARYGHHDCPCRCPECREANTRYIARWRNGGTGTWSTPGRSLRLENDEG